MTGTIKKILDKGFGFITPEGKNDDIFFHSKELQGITFADLREGDTVEFETREGDKGLSAVKVRKA